MRLGIFAVGIIFLCGCSGVPSTPLLPNSTQDITSAVATMQAPSDLTALVPATTNTIEPLDLTQDVLPTDQPPCDPGSVDYCIEEGHLFLSRPIASPGNDQIEATYRYGATQNGLRDPHHGVEFPNPYGTPVLAAANGEVIFAGSDQESTVSPWSDFYGNAVVIKHFNNERTLFTLYGHLSRVDVVPGQMVAVGTKIGEVGSEGAAIGSHLHFEVRLGSNDYASTRNPELWLVPRTGEGAMAIQVIDKKGKPVPAILNIQKDLGNGSSYEAVPQVEAYSFKEKFPVTSDNEYDENYGLSDLSAGRYRITSVYLGKLYERFVEVQSGKLTLVTILVK